MSLYSTNVSSQVIRFFVNPAYADLHMIPRDINLQSMLYHARFDSAPNIQVSVYSVPDLARPPFREAIKGIFRPAKVGESFGPSWVSVCSYSRSRGHDGAKSDRVRTGSKSRSWFQKNTLLQSV